MSAGVYSIQKAVTLLIEGFKALGLDPPVAIVLTPHQVNVIETAALKEVTYRPTSPDEAVANGIPIEVRYGV